MVLVDRVLRCAHRENGVHDESASSSEGAGDTAIARRRAGDLCMTHRCCRWRGDLLVQATPHRFLPFAGVPIGTRRSVVLQRGLNAGEM